MNGRGKTGLTCFGVCRYLVDCFHYVHCVDRLMFVLLARTYVAVSWSYLTFLESQHLCQAVVAERRFSILQLFNSLAEPLVLYTSLGTK